MIMYYLPIDFFKNMFTDDLVPTLNSRNDTTEGQGSIRENLPRLQESNPNTSIPRENNAIAIIDPRDMRQDIVTNTYLHSYKTSTRNKTRCDTCTAVLKEGERVRRLPCMCLHHRRCVDRHITVVARCPNCRIYLRVNEKDL